MFSLVTLFSLMLSPAIIVLVVSLIVGVFEGKSSRLSACDNSSLTRTLTH